MTHLSLTDHGTLSGHREHQRACTSAGIVPILGLEAYISETDRFDKRATAKRSDGTSAYNHITLLAAGETGLANLSRMSEIAWTEGFYNKPRMDLDLLEEYSDGIIVMSGCLNGLIAKAIERGDMDTAERTANRLKAAYGERFFIEVQSHNPPEVNHALLALGDRLGIRPAMASDCHYAREEDLWAEEALLILSTKPKQAKDIDLSKAQKLDLLDRFNYLYPDRKMTFQKFELFLRSYQQESDKFKAQGIHRTDIFENTNVIADMVGEYPYHSGLSLLPQPKTDANSRLQSLCNGGLRRRGCDTEEYRLRIEEELKVIHSKDFAPYFLVVADMISWSKKQGILVGPGRGSAAGSLVCYALGITDVDPLKYNLLFSRFINESRNDFPDIDMDFMDTRRSEVKDYLVRKFKNVASISTFGYHKDKGVIRDAARILVVPLADVNRLLKTLDTYDEYLSNDDAKWFRDKYPDVEKIATVLRGKIRTAGMHAAGVIVANEPLNKYAPIETRKDTSNSMSGRIHVVGLDMTEAESIGMIKFDVLGLKTLTVIDDTVNSVERRHGVKIVPTDIPLDDPAIYTDLSNGFTRGVFQAEAAPYTRLLRDMGVSTFDQLVASNALVRPGAMNTVGVDYIARKQGRQQPVKIHPIYDKITEETYGLPIYQEHVMLLCNELAGMSWSDADRIRKIIGKKKDVSEFEQYKSRFIDGASKHINPQIAEKLWHDFEAHSNYSFNKSHAVAYSMISYWTAWLKHYYPVEFMHACLRNEDKPIKRTEYLIEAKRLRIKISGPHISTSGSEFSIIGDGLQFGLSDVKYISDNISGKIISMRPFASYEDFSSRCKEKGSGVNSRAVSSLNAIGAAVFEDNPITGNEGDNVYQYLGVPRFNMEAISPQIQSNFSNTDDFDEIGNFIFFGVVTEIKRGTGWSRVTILDPTGSVGVFHNEHTMIETGKMYVFLIGNNRIVRYLDPDELSDIDGDPFVRWMNSNELNIPHDRKVVLSFSRRVTKAGKNMATVILSNADKELFCVTVFPNKYSPALARLSPGKVVHVSLTTLDDTTFALKEIK